MSPADGAPREITQANIMASFHEAMALQGAGRHAEALALWAPIAAAAPQSAEAQGNLAVTLQDLFRFDEAEVHARRAVELKPQAGWAHLNLARLLQITGRWREAEAPYRRALAANPLEPTVRLELGHLLLGLGEFAPAWPLIESRLDIPGQHAERLPLPNPWAGEPLDGKSLLIWPEQGFGDQIQFARFAPVLRDRGARVTLVCPPELTALFQTLGVDVVEQSHELTLAAPDYWTLPLSIPGRLGVTLETLPSAPYLRAPQDRREKWAGYGPKGAVGVVWKGRATPNPHRSLPSKDLLAPLEASGRPIVDLTDPIGDFADTAAVLEQLDLLITVDTAIAHLAGAMGKPVWILLPWYRPSWTWLQGRPDSPWHPSARLFRQPAHGDWGAVLEEVARELGATGRGTDGASVQARATSPERSPSQPAQSPTEPTYSPAVFDVVTEAEARAIILTPEGGHSTEDRWAKETPYLADLIGRKLRLREGQLVIDHGCGLGRLSKELIERFGCSVLGVDISPDMRALARDYVNSPLFSVASPPEFRDRIDGGLRADHAISIWVLQHCLDPAEEIALLERTLKDRGRLFVVNNHWRAVPTVTQGWANDGLSVRGLLETAFKTGETGSLEAPHVVTPLARQAFWGMYEKN